MNNTTAGLLIGFGIFLGMYFLGEKIKTASCILADLTPKQCVDYRDEIQKIDQDPNYSNPSFRNHE